MTWTLWQWLPHQDDWVWLTECPTDRKTVTLRGFRRRNPKGTRFKFTEGYKPKKFRRRLGGKVCRTS